MSKKLKLILVFVLSAFLISLIVFNIFIRYLSNHSEKELISLFNMNINTVNTFETKAQLYTYLSSYAFALFNCNHQMIDLQNAKIYIDKALKEDNKNPELYSEGALICINLTKQGIACNPRFYLDSGRLYLNEMKLDNYLLIAYFYKQIGEHRKAKNIMNDFYIYFNKLEDTKVKESLSKDIKGFGLE